MQNYIMLTPKNTYFSMHKLFQELKIINNFRLEFDGENKLN
jgi:hypothetical protein